MDRILTKNISYMLSNKCYIIHIFKFITTPESTTTRLVDSLIIYAAKQKNVFDSQEKMPVASEDYVANK